MLLDWSHVLIRLAESKSVCFTHLWIIYVKLQAQKIFAGLKFSFDLNYLHTFSQKIQKAYILVGRMKEQEVIKISMWPGRDLHHHETEALL